LFYTPPYHCELQPIEMVWGAVKNKVAGERLPPDVLSLRNSLLCKFQEEITSKVVVSCWKKCLNKAKEYWETIEVSIGDESDEDSNTDTDEFDQS